MTRFSVETWASDAAAREKLLHHVPPDGGAVIETQVDEGDAQIVFGLRSSAAGSKRTCSPLPDVSPKFLAKRGWRSIDKLEC